MNINIYKFLDISGEKLKLKENIIKNLFIVHTPYHILLSTSVCLSKQYINCENSIFINDTFGRDERLIENLRGIFKNIYLIQCKKNINFIDELHFIKFCLNDKLYDNIFVNNESEIKTQLIINENLKEDGKLIYIEDGTSNYRSFLNNSKYISDDILNYCSQILNIYIENINFLGGHSRINERYFLYPELVMDKLKNKNNKSINCNLLKDAIRLIYRNYDYIGEDFILIALEHSSFVGIYREYNLNTYVNLIKNIIKELSKSNKNIYIKYHPREEIEYLNFCFQYSNVYVLDKSLAIESLFCENMMLISLRSTSLITFSKLFTSKNAICIQNLLGDFENDLTELFNKVGIFFPNTIDEIILKLNNI